MSFRTASVPLAHRSERAGRSRSVREKVLAECRRDVTMTSRQALHGSFANTSKDWRVTVNFGFHRRASADAQAAHARHHYVLGV